jgi:ERCC4-related helicase
MLRDFVSKNKDKKIIIFTETKDDAKQLCSLQYATFMGLHGDMD